jgi:predicted dinucleotide-binding enzyme
MKAIAFAAAALLFLAVPATAQMKACEELKAEIEEKIKKNGVAEFTLEIVAAADVKDATVVGSCEGGAKKITYKRGGA